MQRILRIGKGYNVSQLDLKQQVEQEQRELAAAPRIEPSANTVGRCHFCGAVTRSLNYVETVGDQERYRGEDCCGH